MSDRLLERLVAPVDEDGAFTLAGFPTGTTPGVDGKDEAKDGLDGMADPLFDLHELLYAEKRRAILLVLQGTDASGKNGTIKHVVRLVNPAGVNVSTFDEPTEEERSHHFLWRIEKGVPEPGELGVFNRSHYEDVLVPFVHGEIDTDQRDQRIDEILEFEKRLVDRDVTIIKCLLHLGYDEQRRRFLRRLRRDDKRWKFDPGDLDTRTRWDDFQLAYGETVAATSPDWAPWYIIPADHKWYRNWAIATLLVETMEAMNLAYPQPDLDVDDLRNRLEPPH